MAKNSSLLLQNSIKNNSEELQDFIRDLKNWEKGIKTVDEKLSNQNKEESTNSETTPPVRCKKKLETSAKDSSKLSSCEIKRRKNEAESKESREKISGYDYAAWDKFDVDKALASDEDEEVEAKPSEAEESNKKGGNRAPKLSKKERAVALKDEGNKMYSSGRLDEAIAKYTQGMALDPTNPLLPANRAMAYIKIKKFPAAEADCNKCLKLDGSYVKGYLRRATARMSLDKKEQALKDYQKVLELEPWNKEAKKEVAKYKNITSPTEETSKCDDRDSTEKRNDGVENIAAVSKGVESKKTNITERLNFEHNEKDSKRNEKQSKVNERPPGKKLKIIEVNSEQDQKQKQQISADPNCVLPVNKPPHLRSTKPLKKVAVVDVASRGSIGKEVQGASQVKPGQATQETSQVKPGQATQETSQVTTANTSTKQQKTSAEVKTLASEGEEKVVACTKVPKTSHQFTKEWNRISRHQTQAVEYLKIIPEAFLSSVELEADTVMEVVSTLRTEAVSAVMAAQCLMAISRSPGFSVNLMFLNEVQKEELLEVINKCEGGGSEDMTQFEHIKKCLV